MTSTADQISGLLEYFAPHCVDKATLNQLRAAAVTPAKWKTCYWLFMKIRAKTLRAERRGDRFHQHQYLFEEICAKTLYNLSVHPNDYAYVNPAPFDDDSADYVIPIAAQFADYLKIPQFDPSLPKPFFTPTPKSEITISCTEAPLARFSKRLRGLFGLGDR